MVVLNSLYDDGFKYFMSLTRAFIDESFPECEPYSIDEFSNKKA